MIRPTRWWLCGILVIFVALTAIEYLALTWVIPRYAVHVIRHAMGEAVEIGDAQLHFPFTLVFTDVRIEQDWPVAGLYAKRVAVKPRWISWRANTVTLGSVDIEQLWVRLSRTADGKLVWPSLQRRAQEPTVRGRKAREDDRPPPASVPKSQWKVSVGGVNLVDGTIAFLDEQMNKPFYGVLDHISVAAGPVKWPPTAGPVTLAIRGEIVGHAGHGAPVYCSGWLNPIARNLEASCRLEPLALAAFEPYYYRGRVQARVYEATLNSTSQWSARNNKLDGRIQLTIENLGEGDLSVRGATLVDIKELAAGESPTLTGEVKVTGPLDAPSEWQLELVPGNEIVQRLVKPLLDRGREVIRLRVGGERIKVGISTATEAEMSDIEETSKQVEEALEILSAGLTEAALPTVAEASPPSTEGAPAEPPGETPESSAVPAEEGSAPASPEEPAESD